MNERSRPSPMMKSQVAVLKTTPTTVVADYKRLMRLAGYERFLPPATETALRINTSWHYFYPAVLHNTMAVGRRNLDSSRGWLRKGETFRGELRGTEIYGTK